MERGDSPAQPMLLGERTRNSDPSFCPKTAIWNEIMNKLGPRGQSLQKVGCFGNARQELAMEERVMESGYIQFKCSLSPAYSVGICDALC